MMIKLPSIPCVFLVFIVLWQQVTFAQILPSDWKKSIVSIDQKANNSFSPFGTGFMVLYNKINFLVTNKHVATNPDLYIVFNTKSKSTFRLSIDSMILYSKYPWGISQNEDVAIIPLWAPLNIQENA